jgi:hypothetical protein
MCLRFAFLLITRMTTWLRLSWREQAWQTPEILILRHQLAVLPQVAMSGGQARTVPIAVGEGTVAGPGQGMALAQLAESPRCRDLGLARG